MILYADLGMSPWGVFQVGLMNITGMTLWTGIPDSRIRRTDSWMGARFPTGIRYRDEHVLHRLLYRQNNRMGDTAPIQQRRSTARFTHRGTRHDRRSQLLLPEAQARRWTQRRFNDRLGPETQPSRGSGKRGYRSHSLGAWLPFRGSSRHRHSDQCINHRLLCPIRLQARQI